MDIAISLQTILARIEVIDTEGGANIRAITGVATLTEAKPGDLSFIASSKYIDDLKQTRATVVLINKGIEAKPTRNQLFLWVDNASLELARLCEIAASQMWEKPSPGIHRTAIVGKGVKIDESASIGAYVTIEDGVVIGPGCVVGPRSHIGASSKLGKDSRLAANVVLERDTKIGDRVLIHAGVIIGADGFGYEFLNGAHHKIPQIGYVEIGDDVEIGANSTIDRGRLGPTKIGEGTKIDNLVQIGHNVVTGKHCILCGHVGIAGSTTLGDYVVLGGKVGVAGHITIGTGAQVAGGSLCYGSLEGGKKYGGHPAIPLVAHQRIAVVSRKLPDMFKRLKRLEEQMLQESE